MTKQNIKSAAKVERFQVYSNGSDANATLTYGRYTFACSHLGKPSMTLTRPVSGSRVEHKIALDVCRKAYAELMALNCGAEWMALNAAMYAEAVA